MLRLLFDIRFHHFYNSTKFPKSCLVILSKTTRRVCKDLWPFSPRSRDAGAKGYGFESEGGRYRETGIGWRLRVEPMKLFLTAIRETDQLALLRAHASFAKRHELASDPASSDVILIFGSSALAPEELLENAVYKAFPDRCVVYTEEDYFLPLLPTLHTSAQKSIHSRIGRVFNYAYIARNGRHANRFIGERTSAIHIGKAAEKRYLFSFMGGSSSLVRKRLFNLKFDRSDVLVENTSSYRHWDNSQPDRYDRQRRYAEVLAASHFVLCPRGAGTGSIRLFEVMAAKVAPVLISDDYVLTPGPDWDRFLIRVRERDIARLPEILEPQLASAPERGRLARKAFDDYFRIENEFDRVADLAARALRHGSPHEEYFRKRLPAMIRHFRWKLKTRAALRSTALHALKTLHLKYPYAMNR